VTAAATDRGSAPDERGHVFIEFLFIVLPLLCLFLGTLQTVLLYSAKLATLQAARVAARTAAVLPVDDPDLVRLAAATPLLAVVPASPASDLGAATDVIFTPTARLSGMLTVTRRDLGDLVEVEVVFDAPCPIPLGRLLLCRDDGGESRRLTGTATAHLHRITY
jgi:Flp pilus assembly protein TadG